MNTHTHCKSYYITFYSNTSAAEKKYFETAYSLLIRIADTCRNTHDKRRQRWVKTASHGEVSRAKDSGENPRGPEIRLSRYDHVRKRGQAGSPYVLQVIGQVMRAWRGCPCPHKWAWHPRGTYKPRCVSGVEAIGYFFPGFPLLGIQAEVWLLILND